MHQNRHAERLCKVIIIIILIYINLTINYIYPWVRFEIIMKIREIIQEFMPCEVCGNRDIQKFYFHVFVHKGSQPYVKCCECEEEYYSTKARKVLSRAEDAFRLKTKLGTALRGENYPGREFSHPFLKALAGI